MLAEYRLFFPTRRSLVSRAFFSWESWVEIRDWPMPKMDCSSATFSSSCCRSMRMRTRVGSAMIFRESIIDVMGMWVISTHQDSLMQHFNFYEETLYIFLGVGD